MTDKSEKKQGKFTSLNSLTDNKDMVCGPNGCSLAAHYDWTKDKKVNKKQKH